MPTNQNKLPKEELKKLKELRKRTPEEWAYRIEGLPSSIRTAAAKLVWWDHFGLRTVADRWPHLDGYLKFSDEEAPFAPLAEALITLGYPEKVARTRADNPLRK